MSVLLLKNTCWNELILVSCHILWIFTLRGPAIAHTEEAMTGGIYSSQLVHPAAQRVRAVGSSSKVCKYFKGTMFLSLVK